MNKSKTVYKASLNFKYSWIALVLFTLIPIETPAQTGLVLEEVTVTARKREESLQDIPIAITALNGEELESAGIVDSTQFYGRVPSLAFSTDLLSPGNDFAAVVIRGVGAQTEGVPAVGTFIDGNYVPGLGFTSGFLDVERVEILKGPQATLFGRNTEGGAVNIVTRKPSDEVRRRVTAGFDSNLTASASGVLSGPITEQFFASVAASATMSDGYLDAPFANRSDIGFVPGSDTSESANSWGWQ